MDFEVQFPNEPQTPGNYFIRAYVDSDNVELFYPKKMLPLRGMKQCYMGPAHVSVKWDYNSQTIVIKNMTNWTLNIKKNSNSRIIFIADLQIQSKNSAIINIESSL